ncbi:MAG TPA: MFS transporter [Anaerolineales bacterium]|nr:MFS transporter [Anaerolineales bacterium]
MLTKLFHQTTVPREYRSNFLHLYFDIGWYGVLSGSAISFLTIYAARIGATGFQIGLLGAISAAVNLFLAIPAGRWLETRHTGRAVFWAAVFYRIGYLPFIFLPQLLNEQGQILAILLITFLMAVPLTPIGVGFNALFAEAVPNEYRAHVAGMRNVMLAITFMLTSLLSGYILDKIPFPNGYQIVFAIGALGAAMSSFHLYFVKPVQTDSLTSVPLPQPRADPGQKALSPRNLFSSLRMDIWGTPFRSVLLALFAFHFTQYLAVPLFPIYNVRVLQLNDDNIGIGTALFYLTVLLGSTQIRKLAQSFGNKNLTGWSVAGLGLYPILLAMSTNAPHFYGVSLMGGLFFAFVAGSYANYMLECIPAHDRPSHLAWYTIILNAAVLIGSLGGPMIADLIGLSGALVLFGILRFLAGGFILKWG